MARSIGTTSTTSSGAKSPKQQRSLEKGLDQHLSIVPAVKALVLFCLRVWGLLDLKSQSVLYELNARYVAEMEK